MKQIKSHAGRVAPFYKLSIAKALTAKTLGVAVALLVVSFCGAVARAAENFTLTGVVESNLAGDDFMLRADNGHSYRVRAVPHEPGTLMAGDRVRVYGDWQVGMIRAKNVRTLRHASLYYRHRNQTLIGVITSLRGANQFVLRTGNGYTYQVSVPAARPSGLSTGDRVRVYGDWRSGLLHARSVRVLREGSTPGAVRSSPRNLTLTGVVTADLGQDHFVLRASNGYTYQVRAVGGEPGALSQGARVRVYGDWKEGVLHASNVRILRPGNRPNYGDPATGDASESFMTLAGDVTRELGGDHFMIRLGTGKTYRVRAVWGKPRTLSAGDQVQAFGKWSEGVLHASNVRVLRDK